MAYNYEIYATPNQTRIMQRAKGPKPTKGVRMNRIVVKYHDDELKEIDKAFKDHPQHPATWMRERSLQYARQKNKKK